MGIRFHCPNGHKLNVKSDLAGKRAICPECGAKFVVPAPAGQAVTELPMPSALGLPLAMPSGIGVQPSAPAAVVAPPPAAAPTASWYVRPKSGGQFGPATDEVFRLWIAEGRIENDAHVWRDGWAEWKLVRDVSDALPIPQPAPPVAPAVVRETTPVLEAPEPSEAASSGLPAVGEEAVLPASRYLASRRRASQQQITLAVMMLIAIVVLAGILIWVLNRGEAPAKTNPPTTRSELAEPNAAAYVACRASKFVDGREHFGVRPESLTYERTS